MKIKVLAVFALMLLWIFSLDASNTPATSQTDSLIRLLPSAKNTARVDLLNKIVKEHYKTGASDSIEKYLNPAIALSQQLHYKLGEAEALLLKGKCEISTNSQLDKATFHLLKSLAIYDSLQDDEGISNCNLQLGVLSFTLQNYSDAVQRFKKSIKHQKKRPLQGTAHYLIALSYSEMDSIAKAIVMFDIALNEYTSTNNEMGILQCKTFIGKMYSNTGEYNRAIQHLNQTYVEFKHLKDSSTFLPLFAFLSAAYLGNKDYKNAIRYGNEAYRLSTNTRGATMYLKEAMNSLHVAYKNTGNTEKAYFFLNKLNSIKDSIYGNTMLQRISEMKGKYDFAQQLSQNKAKQDIKDAIAIKELQKQKLLRNGFLGGFAVVLLFAAVFFVQRNKISKGKKRSDELLLNILPAEVAEELKHKGSAEAKQFELVTVMFTDFKNFTKISETLSPAALVAEIDTCYKAFDHIITKYNIEKIKTIGDSYMCAGGLPVANHTNPTDVVSAALEIQHFMEEYVKEGLIHGKEPFEIRIGIHTGSVVAGIVGVKKFAYDIWGDTVNIASRMESSGEAGRINISGATYELVKDKFDCTYRGKIEAKYKGQVDMYFVNHLIQAFSMK